ncbi:MAG: phosphatidate cytidylyltransferase [Paludibacteraceae bacterium]
MNNLVQRTLSGAVYVALVVAGILVHPIFFGVLFLVVSVLATREYMCLRGAGCFLRVVSMLASALLFVMAWWVAFAEWDIPWLMPLLLAMYLLTVGLTLVSELFRKAPDPVKNWGDLLVSQGMIALPFALMNGVMMLSPWLLLALFVLIWLNDSGAYCVGSLLGKRKGGNHKMFPRVSPNKSWEGLVGGAVVAMAAGCLLAFFGWFDALPLLGGCRFVAPLIFSAIVVVFGTLGDLMESLLKRTIGVKDSGKFMPGHGGVLDRFDSILLATPAVIFFLWLLNL